jgi:hypothetical protein
VEPVAQQEMIRLSALPAKGSIRLKKGRRSRASARYGKGSIVRSRGR